jgi:hypothetical protein
MRRVCSTVDGPRGPSFPNAVHATVITGMTVRQEKQHCSVGAASAAIVFLEAEKKPKESRLKPLLQFPAG